MYKHLSAQARRTFVLIARPAPAASKQNDLMIGRQGRVEEIAPTALLLATEAAAFYVGTTFNPNGGDVMI